ncbi:MAG: hypothetical protein H7Y88_00925, partial [Phycisphaerales bacterium]|nr:hypothetical protein [Phycisphaerales bacterium]
MNTTQIDIPGSRLVLATANPHKVAELRALLRGPELLGLGDLPGGPFPEPAETGRTFEENAAIKAKTYARATGMVCLADDSGLEIDALGGAPGVISSHYCTDGREVGMSRAERDEANNGRVLRELAGVPAERRTARFVCVMCVARPDGLIVVQSRGTFEGRVGEPGGVPRGDYGFGYDPLFLMAPEFAQTSAELSTAEKNRL